jgi:rhodanese-related sulfurtransferase
VAVPEVGSDADQGYEVGAVIARQRAGADSSASRQIRAPAPGSVHDHLAEGSGLIHIPLHELLGRLAEVPAGEVWVHCAAGYRASIAASILAAAGHQVVAVDDAFDQAAAAGLPITTAVHEPVLSNR